MVAQQSCERENKDMASAPSSSSTTDNTSTSSSDLTASLQILANVAQHLLPSVAQTVFFVGDGLQRTAIDAVFDLLTPRTWQPTNLYRSSVSLLKGFSALSQVLSPQKASLAWQELKNKIDVFTLVKNLDARLGLKTDQFTPLPELVEKAYSIVTPWEALWAVEGTGHYYADEYWKRYGEPRGLLSEENAPVPIKSLTMLHAGLGLSVADRLLGTLTVESSAPEVRTTLELFVNQCENNSRKGYAGAAIESLGLVSRDFYPELLKLVSENFRIVAPELMGYFWRGAGRALYYSRKYFTPVLYSLWDGVVFEHTTETERNGELAGRVWASTLVNMQHPAIMENMLRTYHRSTGLGEAFANGVASCMTMRQDITPNETFVINFYNHQPSGDANFKSLWNRYVGTPARSAVETYQPVLHEQPALEEVFRYQDLDKLTQKLKAQKTAH
jgi:hypothetical protein